MWSNTIYVKFADEPTAVAVATQLGVTFFEGTPSMGNENFALKSPITSQDNDGYWAMLRLNSDWTGFAQTMTALTPFIREVQNPTEVFA